MHLKGIFFIRNTGQNLDRVCQSLKDPVFSSYYLCKFRRFYWNRLFEHGGQRRHRSTGRLGPAQRSAASAGGLRRLLGHKLKSIQPGPAFVKISRPPIGSISELDNIRQCDVDQNC